MIEMTLSSRQDSKFEPWRSEAEHATSRSRRLPTILTFTRGWGRNIFCFFQTAETGNRTPNSGVKGSGANYYPRAPVHPLHQGTRPFVKRGLASCFLHAMSLVTNNIADQLNYTPSDHYSFPLLICQLLH